MPNVDKFIYLVKNNSVVMIQTDLHFFVIWYQNAAGTVQIWYWVKKVRVICFKCVS